ncbi:MAG: universal stress protein UspA [Pseudonocardiales bacterium]|nr:MAG: universal stress protein UspA [Pseudonocardiales bacterium]
MMMHEQAAERIVVGVDQSPTARSILEFAVREAIRRGARLDVVTAYHDPQYWAIAYGVPAPPVNPGLSSILLSGTKKLVDEVVGEIPGGRTNLAAIRVDALPGSAANVLLAAAEGADLLVVGHRGHGGFTSMVLGSVGMQCVLHAPCPITVVRPTTAAVSVRKLEGARS